MKYHLSKRQQKELANQKELCIALPIETLPADADQFIRDMLELPAGATIIRPIESIIRVSPLVRSTGLAGVLGTIIQDDDDAPGGLELSLNVVSFHLSTRREPRGHYPTQWPGSVILDSGRRLPEDV